MFWRRRRERDLDRELRAHLDLEAELRGSRDAARRALGNAALVKEEVREAWGWMWLDRLWQDLRYSGRMLRRSPVFTAPAVLSLALGIGANTAIFSLLDALMLRALPVADPGRLVELLFKAPGQDRFNGFSWQSYQHYRDYNHVFAGVVGFTFTPLAVRGDGLDPETVRGLYVSATYFPVLGVQPAAGRLIGPEDTGSSAYVAVVSWAFWQSRFHLDPGIVGKRIVVDGFPVTIVSGPARVQRAGAGTSAGPVDAGGHGFDGPPPQLRRQHALLSETGGSLEAGCVHRNGARGNGGSVPVDDAGRLQRPRRSRRLRLED